MKNNNIEVTSDSKDSLIEALFEEIKLSLEKQSITLSGSVGELIFQIRNRLKKEKISEDSFLQLNNPIIANVIIGTIQNYVAIHMEKERDVCLQLEVDERNQRGKSKKTAFPEVDIQFKKNPLAIPVKLKLMTTPLLKGQHNNKAFYFTRTPNKFTEQVDGDYFALGTSSATVLEDLLGAVNEKDFSVIQKIADQIYSESVANPETVKLSTPWKLKIKKWVAQQKLEENNVSDITTAIFDEKDSVAKKMLEKELKDANQSVDTNKNAFQQQLKDPDLICDYLKNKIQETERFDIGIAIIWKQINNKNVCIWTKSNTGEGIIPKEGYSYFSELNTTTDHLFYNEKDKYFECLNEQPTETVPFFTSASEKEDKMDLEQKEDFMEEELENSSDEEFSTKLFEVAKNLLDSTLPAYLGVNAFQKPVEEKAQNSAESSKKYEPLYGTDKRISDYDSKNQSSQNTRRFKDQFLFLLQKLQGLMQAQLSHPQAIAQVEEKFTLFSQSIFNKNYAGNQTDHYFESVKFILEEITLLFLSDKVSKTKKGELIKDILSAFVCAPGLYTKLEMVYDFLQEKSSLEGLLEQYRKTLILMYCDIYIRKKNKEKKKENADDPQSIHIMNTFLAYARNENWIQETVFLKDQYIKNEGVNAEDLTHFHKWFLENYNPVTIGNYLVTGLLPKIKDLKELHKDNPTKLYASTEALLKHVGVDISTYRIFDSETSEFAINESKLKKGLLYGLMEKGIFSSNIKETCQTFEFNKNEKLFYFPICLGLSYVEKLDGTLLSFDNYLPDLKETTLTKDQVSQAIKSGSTLLIFLFSQNKKISPQDKKSCDSYMDSVFEKEGALFTFLSQLLPNQKTLFFENGGLTPKQFTTSIKSWGDLRRLIEHAAHSKEGKEYISKMLAQDLTPEQIKIFLCSTKDEHPHMETEYIVELLSFDQKNTFWRGLSDPQLSIWEIMPTPKMLMIMKPSDILLFFQEKNSRETYNRFLQNPEDLVYVLNAFSEAERITFLTSFFQRGWIFPPKHLKAIVQSLPALAKKCIIDIQKMHAKNNILGFLLHKTLTIESIQAAVSQMLKQIINPAVMKELVETLRTSPENRNVVEQKVSDICKKFLCGLLEDSKQKYIATKSFNEALDQLRESKDCAFEEKEKLFIQCVLQEIENLQVQLSQQQAMPQQAILQQQAQPPIGIFPNPMIQNLNLRREEEERKREEYLKEKQEKINKKSDYLILKVDGLKTFIQMLSQLPFEQAVTETDPPTSAIAYFLEAVQAKNIRGLEFLTTLKTPQDLLSYVSNNALVFKNAGVSQKEYDEAFLTLFIVTSSKSLLKEQITNQVTLRIPPGKRSKKKVPKLQSENSEIFNAEIFKSIFSRESTIKRLFENMLAKDAKSTYRALLKEKGGLIHQAVMVNPEETAVKSLCKMIGSYTSKEIDLELQAFIETLKNEERKKLFPTINSFKDIWKLLRGDFSKEKISNYQIRKQHYNFLAWMITEANCFDIQELKTEIQGYIDANGALILEGNQPTDLMNLIEIKIKEKEEKTRAPSTVAPNASFFGEGKEEEKKDRNEPKKEPENKKGKKRKDHDDTGNKLRRKRL